MPATSAPAAPKGSTPIRTVRVEDELWLPALKRAQARGETLSDVLREALEAYVK